MNNHPMEGRLRDALAAHAQTFSASPDAWQHIQAKDAGLSGQRRGRPVPPGAGWLARHSAFVLPAAAAATVVAVALSVTALAHGFSGTAGRGAVAQSATSQPTGSGGPRAGTSNGCAGQPPVSPLPVWARSGFSPANQAMPHVMGETGNIVAILWASRDALHSPPLQGRNNKILWVSRIPLTGSDPLVIKATLAGGTRTATVSVPGGPGPSIIDLPAPGCWTFHLSWSGHTDELKLRYAA
jgi:hypothetical protein